jgi:hypothetical protein
VEVAIEVLLAQPNVFRAAAKVGQHEHPRARLRVRRHPAHDIEGTSM